MLQVLGLYLYNIECPGVESIESTGVRTIASQLPIVRTRFAHTCKIAACEVCSTDTGKDIYTLWVSNRRDDFVTACLSNPGIASKLPYRVELALILLIFLILEEMMGKNSRIGQSSYCPTSIITRSDMSIFAPNLIPQLV